MIERVNRIKDTLINTANGTADFFKRWPEYQPLDCGFFAATHGCALAPWIIASHLHRLESPFGIAMTTGASVFNIIMSVVIAIKMRK